MAYVIDLDRTTSQSIRRVLRKTLDKAARALHEPSQDGDRTHDARVSIKKARALLRLAQHDVTGARVGRERGALRGVGRSLSAVRDATALIEAFDKLLEGAGEEDRAQILPLRVLVEARRAELEAHESEQVAEAARVLACACARAARITPAHRGWKAIARGLDRAYRRARERFARAYETGKHADFHALRKAAKNLSYQARFLEPIDQARLRDEAERLERIGALLGDDHDLAVLRELVGGGGGDADPSVRTRFDALAAERQAALRAEARGLVADLLAERPKQRLSRLEEAFHRAHDSAH